MLPYNKNLKQRSRELRSNMTDAETALWAKLRRQQLARLQFYRQKPIGAYIVDFYCPAARLVIEIDGGQHYEDQGMSRDAKRDACLNTLGLCVLRFSNLDVLTNIDGVIATIIHHVEAAIGQKSTKSP